MTTPTQERPQLQSKLGRRYQSQQQSQQWGYQDQGQPTTLELFSQIPKEQFGQEIAKRFKGAEQVANAVIQVVQQGLWTPLEGLQVISCATGSPFAYAAFHSGAASSPSAADMASVLARMTTE